MATQFENFVNKELPKRISTEQDPLTLPVGKILITTGIGLGVEFQDPSELVNSVSDFASLGVGVLTVKEAEILPGGVALIPNKPFGDFLFNQAIVHLNDGSVVDINGISYLSINDEHYVKMNVNDYNQLIDIAVSMTVSYIGNLI